MTIYSLWLIDQGTLFSQHEKNEALQIMKYYVNSLSAFYKIYGRTCQRLIDTAEMNQSIEHALFHLFKDAALMKCFDFR